ncbi:MAG: Multidrug resistance protein MdtA [Fimbriimonadaceae bacterium]|nr:Multidrug resistance protein MdtA [Fimbriimonadaceae bacterium]
MKNRTPLVALVILGCSLTGCVDRASQQQAKRTEELLTETVKPVVVADVTTQRLQETLTVSGAIQTADDSMVGAKVGGRLVSVFVRDGDPVRAGQVIARQETSDASARLQQANAEARAARSAYQQALQNYQVGPAKSRSAIKSAEAQLRSARAQLDKVRRGAREEERAQARASVDAAKANLQAAKSDLDRSRALYAEGAISKQQLEAAENRHATALSQYENALQSWNMMDRGARAEDIVAAEQQVRVAEEALRMAQENQRLDPVLKQQVDAARANLEAAQAGVRLAQQSVGDATIRSPFTGRISGKPTQVGTYIAPGTPVARIVGIEGVYFEGEVPESQIQLIVPGREVEVVIEALNNLSVPGSVVAVNPLGQDVGRIFRVRVRLMGETSAIKPGMFGTGKIVLRTVPDAVVVPQRAIVTQGAERSVFVVVGDTAKKKVVKVGLSNGEYVQVSEVTLGEKVVVQGQSQLIDGTKVKIEAPQNPASGEKTAAKGS